MATKTDKTKTTKKTTRKGVALYVRISKEAHSWIFEKAGPGKGVRVSAEVDRLILQNKRKTLALREARKDTREAVGTGMGKPAENGEELPAI